MTYAKNGAGRGGRGVVPRDKVPTRRRRQDDPIVRAVYDRAFDLVRAVWVVERWKSSVTTKVPTYLAALIRGQKVLPPKGVPPRIVLLVQRAIAQACLERGATGLKAQEADWYGQAAEAARAEMPNS